MRRSAIATVLLLLVLAGCASPNVTATPTPTEAIATATAAGGSTCGAPTPAVDEGPFYKPGSPEETSLVGSGLPGTPLVLTGLVLDPACQPIAGATLDFWQADDAGKYDNAGYTLRGHLETDAAGRYTVTTILPGLYTGRTRHIHVKVQAPGGPILTSQLYVPDEPGNAGDPLFNPATVMTVTSREGGLAATFTFVVATH